jgi:hypothetical protein
VGAISASTSQTAAAWELEIEDQNIRERLRIDGFGMIQKIFKSLFAIWEPVFEVIS